MDSHHYFVRSPKLIGVSPAVSDLDFPLDEGVIFDNIF